MTLHTCSYYCDRPECIKAQRDELRDRAHAAQEVYAGFEGFIPQTAPEGYCLWIIRKMAHALMGVSQSQPQTPCHAEETQA
jgi:hypothetical protein